MKNKITPPIRARIICYIEDEIDLFCLKYGNIFSTNEAKEITAEKIIIAIIKDIVFNRSNYAKDKFDLHEVVWYYLNKTPSEDSIGNIINSMFTDLVNLRTMVIQFIGNDKWVMHFVKENANQICIEKSIDYRIYDWSVNNNASL